MGKQGRRKIVIYMVFIILSSCIMGGCSKTGKDSASQVTEDVSAEGTLEVTIPSIELEALPIPENDALEFVKDMRCGWNLGNTFDAYNDSSGTIDDLLMESAWCGVKTTEDMIAKVKEAGFNTIRIPVSWHNHVSGSSFTINEAWLNRVQEVVDYAIGQDMYVILNIHHDISKEYCYPSQEYMQVSSNYISSIWSQLASRFCNYNDKLLFESINEPRLVGTENEWWLDVSSESCKQAVECINQWNQLFVDTVRSNGGENASRYLVVPGYGASADGALTSLFQLPTDIEGNENRIIVSVHAYTPYNFALQSPTEAGSTQAFSASSADSQKDILSFMSQLYDKYISKGIPVIIGEFSARDKSGNLQDRVEYAAVYTAAARVRGITCCWWDNNAFSGASENFGLLDRRTLSWQYTDIVKVLIQYSK
ncbi:MAG TPA: glycoside hydrolase family 5 protein [Lachnospiraceae bacterium]|nr:glycoside hydrolase family 5 protein [Lachnospiraceae bacterium]